MATRRGNHSAAISSACAVAFAALAVAPLFVGCGRSSFAGKADPTPTPEPTEPPPLSETMGNNGSDAASITTEGGLESLDKGGTASGTTEIGVTTRADSPKSLGGTPAPSLGPGTGGVKALTPCTANHIRVSGTCVAALPLYKWTLGSKEIVSVRVNDNCAQDSDAACQGLRLRSLGYAYAGIAGYVFPESSREALVAVGVTPSQVVVCHKLQFGSDAPDALYPNPTSTEVSSFGTRCASGTESFLVSSAARAEFLGLVSLESQQTVGYIRQP